VNWRSRLSRGGACFAGTRVCACRCCVWPSAPTACVWAERLLDGSKLFTVFRRAAPQGAEDIGACAARAAAAGCDRLGCTCCCVGGLTFVLGANGFGPWGRTSCPPSCSSAFLERCACVTCVHMRRGVAGSWYDRTVPSPSANPRSTLSLPARCSATVCVPGGVGRVLLLFVVSRANLLRNVLFVPHQAHVL
jgi:hypothetical protein